MKTPEQVADRCAQLLYLNRSQRDQRTVIRQILNGGPESARLLVGDDAGDYLPVANWVLSGIDRLAQKTQQPPNVKVEPSGAKDGGTRERKYAETREDAIVSFDRWSKLPLMLPQMVRWMAGYGFASVTITQGESPDGQVFPDMRLRDTYGAFPAPWGDNQQPEDIVYLRRVPESWLREHYPHLGEHSSTRPYQTGPGGAVILGRDTGGWENQTRSGVLIYEYHDNDGIHMMLGDSKNRFDMLEVPCKSFRVAKRFAFDELVGQYDHTLGLMQQVARLNLLAFISVTDSVFSETNIYGDLTSGDYERGRFATNHFSAGTRVERPTDRNVFQAFNQIDRLEGQLRETANYPVSDDGQAATAWVTGQGQRELGASGDNLVREYQTVIADLLQETDFIRLKLDEDWWPDEKRTTVTGYDYIPSKHTKGNYVTRRVYGAMAGLDSSSKTIGLLNLNQAGLLDRVSAMENLDGIDNVQLVLDRQRQDEVRDMVKNQLIPAMLQGQPIDERATRLLVAQLPKGEERDLYEQILFPEEDDIAQPPPVEEAPAPMANPGDDVTTVLARLNGDGSSGSGVQTVMTV